MKKIITLACLFAFTGVAFAGFSLGFKRTEVPYEVHQASLSTMDVNMLRVGAMASPSFRIEGCVGYVSNTFEWEDNGNDMDATGSGYVLSGGGYYVVKAPANTSFSMGAQLIYAAISTEYNGTDGPSTTALCIDPLMRIDFAIPGAEKLAFFTEYGFRYARATTEIDTSGTDHEYKWSGLKTYAPGSVLAGVYYVF